MKNVVLAFDAASSSYSVSVFCGGKLSSYFSESSTLTHSQTLLPAILTALEKSGATTDDIEKIVVTVGPGSFTGLKIAVATAKGLAFAKDIPCVPVSTLKAMAYGHTGEDGVICCTLDARRKMLYAAFFECKNGKITRLTEDGQISAEEAAEIAAGCGKNLILAGDGAKILAERLEDKNAEFVFPQDFDIIDSREMLAAAEEEEEISSLKLLPRYLRKPQAERDREEKLKGDIK